MKNLSLGLAAFLLAVCASNVAIAADSAAPQLATPSRTDTPIHTQPQLASHNQTATTSPELDPKPVHDLIIGVFPNIDGLIDVRNPVLSEQYQKTVEDQVGSLLGNSIYGPFDSDPSAQMQWDADAGRPIQWTWNYNFLAQPGKCVNYQGFHGDYSDYDGMIDAMATNIAAVNQDVYVRLFPGMDASFHDCPYGSADPAIAGPRFIMMWQYITARVHTIAPNAKFIFAPNIHAFTDNRGNPLNTWKNFYYLNGASGDHIDTDWMGTVLYQSQDAEVRLSDYKIFTTWYNTVAPLGFPLMLSEFGAIGPNPQRNPEGVGCDTRIKSIPSPATYFLHSFMKDLKLFPAVKGMFYFDYIIDEGTGATEKCYNYELRLGGGTSLGSLGPFKNLVEHRSTTTQ